MRYLLIVLAFVFGPINTDCVIASEAEDLHQYYVSYFDGKWIFEQGGTETVIECEDKGSYNHCSGLGGQVNHLWGYDPVRKAWVGHGRGGDKVWEWVMDQHKGDAIKAGVSLSSVGKSWHPDGTEVSRRQLYTIIDDNSFELQTWVQQDGQEEIVEPLLRARRVQ